MISFIKKQWFVVLIIVILILLQLKSDEKLTLYKYQIKELQEEITSLETKEVILQKNLDSLSTLDKEIEFKIKTIKQKEYVQVKTIDTLPISKLQKFFSERYPK